MAAHAAQETKQVAGQAASQLMDLLSQSRAELAGQASGQQQRLAQGLRSVGAELDQMRGGSQSAGLATETASQLAGRNPPGG